ncbi:MAG: glutathione S-transferase, partial [Halioglobus sp.]|nr:glutathione S-transferase [Halioglobus sp.]
ADMANWAWVRTHNWSGISVEGLGNLSRWLGAVAARPGAQAGVKVPLDIAELMDAKREEDAEAFSRNARSMVTGAAERPGE